MRPIKPHFKRVVSLAPAITELIFALDVADRLVGVTDSCDYPESVREIPNVSLWFEPDLDKLFALQPDLVFTIQTFRRRLLSDELVDRINIPWLTLVIGNEGLPKKIQGCIYGSTWHARISSLWQDAALHCRMRMR